MTLRHRSPSPMRSRVIPTRLLVIPVLLLPVLLVLAACGSDAQEVRSAPTTQPGGSTVPSTTAPQTDPGGNRPGPDDVVFRVVSCCGFVPAEYAYRSVPDVTILGDGRGIVAGPTTMQYPGKALPNLLQGTVSDDVITGLVRRVTDGGLLGKGVDFGQAQVTDMATTTVTIWVDGKDETISVYALDGDFEGQMTAVQKANRKAVRDLVAAGRAAVDGADQPYEATRVTVRSLPVAEPSDGGTGITPGTAEWPLDDPAKWPTAADQDNPCRTYEGAEATAVLKAAESASEITRWTTADGTQHHLVLRPLLPDEHDLCTQS